MRHAVESVRFDVVMWRLPSRRDSSLRHPGLFLITDSGKGASMTVKDVMTANPDCCTPESSLQEIARLMVECDCGEIPVCDESNKPVGVVTDRDIVCRVVAKGQNPSDLTARDCMSGPVVTATPDVSIEDCARLMEQYQVRRLPVVDESGTCCGMIAQADFARKAPRETTIEVVEKISEPSGMAVGAGGR
jgi:CBS domain-containing protein